LVAGLFFSTVSCRTTNVVSAGPVDNFRGKPSNTWGIELGEGLPSCRLKVNWKEIPARDILEKDPFRRTLCFLRPEASAAWTDGVTNSSGWPSFLVAVFSTPRKDALSDLLELRSAFLYPRVHGEYEKNLRSICPGWRMTDVYKAVGQERCDYYLDSNGRWRVRFVYFGFGGTFFGIEADAGSGVVLKASDVTL